MTVLSQRSKILVAAGFGGLVTVLAFLGPVTAGFSHIPGDLGDARFNSVILEHVFRWLTGHEASLWSPGFFFPFRNVLAFSDNHFGSVVAYAVARLIGFDREYAYLAWFAIGVLLNFMATFYVLKRFGFGSLAAACGAFLFAAGLPTIFKTAHAQLTYRFAVPLAFWFMYAWLRDAKLRDLLCAVLFTVWQFFCSIYLGVFLIYALVFLFMVRVGFGIGGRPSLWVLVNSFRRSALRSNILMLMLSVLACGLLVVMLHKYAAVSAAYGLGRPSAEIYSMLPVPGSYLISDLSRLYASLGSRINVPMRHEHQMFVGAVAGVFVLAGALMAMRFSAPTVTKVSLAVLSALVLFTMNFGENATLYNLVIDSPGFSSVRAVARIVLIMMLPVAVLVAYSVDCISAAFSRRGLKKLAVASSVICLLLSTSEVFLVRHYNTPISSWKSRSAVVRNYMPVNVGQKDVLLVTWGGLDQNVLSELDGMVVAQDLGMSTLNGYSGNFPSADWLGAAWGSECTNARKRLAAYTKTAPQTGGGKWLDESEQRVVTILPVCCRPGMLVLDDLAPILIRNVRLETEIDGKGNARVTISNVSPLPFSTYTRLGPVRLSWRFVNEGARESVGGWDTRHDLDFSLMPGESRAEAFDVNLPSVPGDYRFEVSLVQEGVRWLHDAGMEKAFARVAVP